MCCSKKHTGHGINGYSCRYEQREEVDTNACQQEQPANMPTTGKILVSNATTTVLFANAASSAAVSLNCL